MFDILGLDCCRLAFCCQFFLVKASSFRLVKFYFFEINWSGSYGSKSELGLWNMDPKTSTLNFYGYRLEKTSSWSFLMFLERGPLVNIATVIVFFFWNGHSHRRSPKTLYTATLQILGIPLWFKGWLDLQTRFDRRKLQQHRIWSFLIVYEMASLLFARLQILDAGSVGWQLKQIYLHFKNSSCNNNRQSLSLQF